MIEASGVGVSLGGRCILRGCDLVLQPGRIVALVGPNGAGKSTLLTTLAGLRVPDEGEVTLHGRRLAALPPVVLARARAFLPQRGEAAFDFTVTDLVLLGRFAHETRGDSERDRQAAARALRAVGCADLSERTVLSLSGGEQQRVRIARALAQIDGAGAPRALLLDEPIAGLDLAHQLAIGRVLRGLATEGVAVALAAHELAWVAGLADELVVLTRGEVPVVGPPEEALSPAALERVFGVRGRLQDGELRLER